MLSSTEYYSGGYPENATLTSVLRSCGLAVISVFMFILSSTGLSAIGPMELDGTEAVSIYRDFDDGLFGRSLYRGIVFSVKLDSFQRYDSLMLPGNPVFRDEGLTACLVGEDRAEQLAAGSASAITRYVRSGGESAVPVEARRNGAPEEFLYKYEQDGIRVMFSLERASKEMYREIERSYPENREAASLVRKSYETGYVVRIHQAENVYRPEFLELDYEDILISATLIGNRFQPLWGIHDGNDICAP